MSAIGTKQTFGECRRCLLLGVKRTSPEWSRQCPLLTQSGHRLTSRITPFGLQLRIGTMPCPKPQGGHETA
jgi:hypothetical protein